MDKYERDMIFVVNLNHDIKVITERLNAISAKRKKKGAKKR
jgi:hypothetical protein